MQTVAEPEFHTWQSFDANARIRISLDVVEKLRSAAIQSPAEVGGLLLGSTIPQTGEIEITGFRPLPRPGRPDRRFTVSPPDAALIRTGVFMAREQSSVAGFYRTHRRDGLRLDADDAAFFRLYFSGPSNVFLLIRPDNDRLCTAGFFSWDHDHMQTDCDVAGFPFEIRPPHPHSRIAPPATVPQPKSRAPRSLRLVTALLTAAILLLAANLFRKPAPKTPAVASPAPAPVSPLGLQVETGKGHLRVAWNQDNPHVQAARSGLLTIADGVHPVETIPLTPRQLRAGVVLYVPSGERMRFRLDVDDGQNTSELVSVIVDGPPARAPVRASK